MKSKTKRLKKRLRERFPKMWRMATYHWWAMRLSSPLSESKFFRQMRRLRRASGSPGSIPDPARRVLFFASRQERDQLAMIATLAWSLERRGSRPIVVGCDAALNPSCNTGFYPKLDPWLCRLCHLYAEHTHLLTGLQTEWLGEIAQPPARKQAEQTVGALSPAEFRSFAYQGYAIGGFVRHSVAHFLRTDRIEDDEEAVAAYRSWLVSAVWLVDACEELVRRHRPDVVVLLNGLFAPEWIMMEVARRHDVRVVAWEVGFRPETFFFQHGRATHMCDNDNWPRFRDVSLTSDENERLDAYMAERATGGGYLFTYFPNLQSSTETICAEFGIDRSKKTAVLFPNITWDSTLFEKNIGFKNMGDWICETIRFFADRPDEQLIIRTHPAEVILPGAARDSVISLIRGQFPELPKNVIIIPPTSGASSYALMNLADCGLVYGSTTGMEMGVRGVPVIVAGQIYYRGLGFTFDAKDRKHYRELLDAVLTGQIRKGDLDRTEAWRRYAYFAIFRSPMPIRQICYRQVGDLPTLRYESLTDLDEGLDANLDAVCRGILEGTPFLAQQSVMHS